MTSHMETNSPFMQDIFNWRWRKQQRQHEDQINYFAELSYFRRAKSLSSLGLQIWSALHNCNISCQI